MYEYQDDSLFPKHEMDALVNEKPELNVNTETQEDMKEEKFDYAKATEELESIARKVEDPEFSLDDIDKYVARSQYLIENCRKYLRTVREKIDEIQ